jgi:hypothetical protein
MDGIIGFLWECCALGTSTKAERRKTYGCIFMVLGALALFFLTLVVAMWLILKP